MMQRRILLAFLVQAAALPLCADETFIAAGSPMLYHPNSQDPGIGLAWTSEPFNASGWPGGAYGVGYETGTGAQQLIATPVPAGTLSVYTRAAFSLVDPSQVKN